MIGSLQKCVAAAAVLTICIAAMGQAAEGPTPKQRAAFNKLLQQRAQLASQLDVLDDRAADMLKRGDDATSVHAEQIAVQDKLDLLELRLGMMGIEYRMEVPSISKQEEAATRSASTARQQQAFRRGRDRAVARMGDDYARFLSALNFSAFLNEREH